MRIIIISFTIFLLVTTNVFAQNSVFRKYRTECAQSFGIELKKLKYFKVVNEMTFFKMSDSNSIGTAYRMALESKNKDCLILYPYFEVIKKMHHVSMGSMTYGEVEAALGFPDINKRKLDIVNGRIMMQGTVESNRANKIMKLDSTKYVKMITGNDMKEYFNADTVYIYKVSLPEDYTFLNTLSKCHKVKYNRCIGINVTKTGRSSAMMKILFTEEGEQKEDEYIQLLLKSVRYSDVAPECNEVKTE